MPTIDAYLGLGANLGHPIGQLRRAVEALLASGAIEPPVRRSSLYRTPPWGHVAGQPWFINAVVGGRTSLTPSQLLEAAKRIERHLGRAADAPRWGPRAIDIDILLYGEEVRDLPGLVIPHPHLPHRAFALVPLLEIAPDLRDPRTGQPYAASLPRLREDAARIERLAEPL